MSPTFSRSPLVQRGRKCAMGVTSRMVSPFSSLSGELLCSCSFFFICEEVRICIRSPEERWVVCTPCWFVCKEPFRRRRYGTAFASARSVLRGTNWKSKSSGLNLLHERSWSGKFFARASKKAEVIARCERVLMARISRSALFSAYAC